MERVDQSSPSAGALRRVPAQARSRDKVERALNAARDLLDSEGVDAVTLNRVAKESGVSVGALYQYLPDRDSIVAALSARYHARHEALADELIDRLLSDPSHDPIDALVDAMVELYRAETATRELRTRLQGAEQVGATRAHKERMVAKVERLVLAQPLARGDVASVARTMFFAADALMHEAFAQNPDGDGALIAELKAMLGAYLAAR